MELAERLGGVTLLGRKIGFGLRHASERKGRRQGRARGCGGLRAQPCLLRRIVCAVLATAGGLLIEGLVGRQYAPFGARLSLYWLSMRRACLFGRGGGELLRVQRLRFKGKRLSV
jgi:hypothetical protein